MTVCGNRTDTPGSFKSCEAALGSCRCGAELRAELLQAQQQPTKARVSQYVRWACTGCGRTGHVIPNFDLRCTCGVITRSAAAE
jgi:hypothetical protein